MNTYKTAEVAAIIGIHPNTVRLYEKLKLIPKPERLANGYRVFTEFHVMQCKLVRIAFQVEILQNGLRKKIARMITVAATKDFDTAIILTKDYLKQLQQERNHAEEAIRFLYKGIIIKHNKTEPTYTKTSLFLCEKRRFFMARTEKGVVATI